MLSADAARSDELDELKAERRKAIEERLRGLGWPEQDLDFSSGYSPLFWKWRPLLEQSKPVTDKTWENLRPQLIPLLEENRGEHAEREKKQRQKERRKIFFELLQKLKPDINPFWRQLEELGFDRSQPPGDSTDDSKPPRSFVNFPFPNYATVLQLPCFGDIDKTEMSREEIEMLFEEHREEVEERITE